MGDMNWNIIMEADKDIAKLDELNGTKMRDFALANAVKLMSEGSLESLDSYNFGTGE